MGIDLVAVRSAVEAWLAEDVGRGDRTTTATVPADLEGRARIEARSPGVIAGLGVAGLCFELASDGMVSVSDRVADGDAVDAGVVVTTIEGPLAPILTAERTALNILGRLCGVASLTRRFVAAIDGTASTIVDTRKTTPGMRALEKYAVTVGGGSNHRFGLDDGILIKDNHVAAAGGVGEAVRRAKQSAPHGLRVEVEVTDLAQLDDALSAGADSVLLDNMSPEQVTRAVAAAGGKVLLEASGGITLDNVRAYAQAGVDLISIGALTHSAPTLDLSLEVETP